MLLRWYAVLVSARDELGERVRNAGERWCVSTPFDSGLGAGPSRNAPSRLYEGQTCPRELKRGQKRRRKALAE